MTRILLVDDSPHAQRIGERILSDEGFEVVTVSNADTALVRLEDVDPDVVVADAVMPGRTGFDICQYIKMNPRFRHVRVIVTAGVLETIDEEQVKRVEADGFLKKPFEASLLVGAVRPLAEAARADRERLRTGAAPSPKAEPTAAAAPFIAVVEPEQVRAAVTIALDASMETMVEEITRRVMAALASKPKPESEPAAALEATVPAPAPAHILPPPPVPQAAAAESEPMAPPPALLAPMLPKPAPPPPMPPSAEPVRRVHALRMRASTSILGLESAPPDEESPLPSDN